MVIKEYYNKKSPTYDSIFNTFYYKIYDEITWKYIEPYISINSNALILDAGGGTGRWAVRMAKKGCKVVLIDVSSEMLKIAAEKVKKERLEDKIFLVKGDISKISFLDETFDVVLCEHVLFLFEDPDVVIKELRRILKRNHRLIISVHNRYVQSLVSLPQEPNSQDLDNAIRILLREKHGALNKHRLVKIYTWTPSEFSSMLKRNGFHIEKVIGKGMTMPLRISKKLFMKNEYPKDLFNKTLQFELTLCEKRDAIALAGHLHAIARKK